MFVLCEIMFPNLTLQFIVERRGARKLDFRTVTFRFSTLLKIVRHVVGREIIAHGIGFRTVVHIVLIGVILVGFALFLFAFLIRPFVILFGSRSFFREIGIILFLQSGIVEHFVTYALSQLGDGQFHHLGNSHLHGLQLLSLHGCLRLFEFLGHDFLCFLHER